jgi:hypothetical protein
MHYPPKKVVALSWNYQSNEKDLDSLYLTMWVVMSSTFANDASVPSLGETFMPSAAGKDDECNVSGSAEVRASDCKCVLCSMEGGVGS